MAINETHTTPTTLKKVRLSDYVVGIFTSISSRKGMKKAIKNGWVTINGRIGQSGDFLNGNEVLALRIQEQFKPILELKLPVLYEDDYLAIINKPAGITVSGNKARTIEHALPYNLKMSSLSDALNYPQAAHRLDHPTSGVLVIGKTRSAVQKLNSLFESKTVDKTYLAICIGTLPQIGIINTPIDEKDSETHFQVLAQKESNKYGFLNLVQLHPKSGRRHQLRIHLASIGCPILGDQAYGIDGQISVGQGLYLHAQKVRFQHPIKTISGKLEIEVAPPKKFKKIFPGRSSL